ncbi:uncharacterized protein CTHT_0002330 [Thermochaetoides thermophila DSM 1495]|uniref:Carboxylic ester hydrolase n=1 Tax=Chaetomium thermophilum (strain DSM 1495 / CBS 144.50 / IMI 039719) TaxID=759272 RepID=G0RZB1_CHATD|nr:hypothetical protein CTHT_0002330 [Thermochaetoides thermophila DSM 1495]EGS23539.1 hypothetical protein CTHT_0002330 [Thermochaetoides thermophila DSM 1495]
MAAQTPAGPQSRPYVVLPQGTYIGITVPQSYKYPKAFEAFRGIPYAQDTSGQNRFRPPQPLPKSSQTFDARFWGPVCPSGGVLRPNMSENCLNLNVYRPAGIVVDRKGFAADGKHPRLPVAVYIHGGAFNWGHGGERNMGSFISWNEQPMISVVFNYRIGALGFLPSNVTEREGLLNLGLRDQQMLLEWVQENIEAFGGDPNNVTIIGLSAGAHSIGHHIMHYARTKKPAPFHKAILESGATTARAVLYPNHPRHETQFREFLAAAGASHVPEAELFPYLRNLPLETIMRASNSVWNKYTASVTWPFQPVIDGPNPHAYSRHLPSARDLTIPVIPDLPIASWLAASHLRIPIITGYNTNEGTNFIPQHADTPADFRNFFKTLIPSLTEADLAELDRLYPDPVAHPATSPYVKVPKGFGRQWARLDAAYSHYAYICPVLQTAHFMTLAGVENVYVYRYAAVSGLGYANHGDEAAVVSHDVDAIGRWAGVVKIADEMCSRWGRFVVSETGDVNRGIKDLNWPKFVSPFSEKEGAGQLLVFGEGNNERAGGKSMGVPVQVRTLTELEKQACKFWWERVWLSEGMGVPRGGGGRRGYDYMVGAACRLRFYLLGTATRERMDGEESWDCGDRMRRLGFANTRRRNTATDMGLLGRSRC